MIKDGVFRSSKSILDELVEFTLERVKEAKQICSLEVVRKAALSTPKGNFSFENALKGKDIAFICECKRASPSKGIISQKFPYLQIAQEYEMAGADCISVLTEPKRFLGENIYLKEIAQMVSIPCLRKDFIIDEYMIYEAKLLGASAVLLISSILSERTLQKYLSICDNLGISALVEVHDEIEVKKSLYAGARLIGVNNRNLKDFSVDITNSLRLRRLIPSNVLFVAESGIKRKKDISFLKKNGADAVLIGETMMKAIDKKAMLRELKETDNDKN